MIFFSTADAPIAETPDQQQGRLCGPRHRLSVADVVVVVVVVVGVVMKWLESEG